MMRKIILSVIFLTAFWMPGYLLAQVKTVVVKGVVTDHENNESMIGVSVLLNGTPIKALSATDTKGQYKVAVPDGATLIFRYIGYAERKITLKTGQTELNVGLSPNVSIMTEQVIRGYQARSREESTGSSYIISGKEIQNIPVSDAEELLQGKVAGLNVQVNTGAPGYRGTVAIRGVSGIDVSGTGDQSYLAPTSPLYVIDGIPVEADATADYGYDSPGPSVSPLSLIPPEDIASIEVLKDVQATSLYGSHGAYGVILITTKRGNSVKPKLRYTSNFFVKTPPKLRTTLGGKAERDAKINEILAMGNYSDLLKVSLTPILSDSLNAYYRNSTDWQGVFYGTTYNNTQNFSIDGGDKTFNYKANLGYYSEKGIIKNTGFDRYSLTMNMDYRPDDKLHIFFSVTGGLGKKNKGNGQGLFQTGVANSAAASSLLPGPSLFQESTSVLGSLTIKDYNNAKNLRPSVLLGYQLFKGLNLSATGSYDYSVNTEETYTPQAANNNSSGVYAYNDRNSTLYGRGGFSYNKGFSGGRHNFNINAFTELYVRDFQAGYITQKRTPNDQLQGPLGASAFDSFGGGVLKSFHNEHTISYAGAFSYDFKKKYILELTSRLDASSLSGFDNPFAKNYSAAVKWNFNKEKFMSHLDWLTFGDIRLTTGRNVKPSGNIYSLYGTYAPNGNYEGSSRVAIDYSTIPNSVLRPTTTTDINLGVDLGFFDSRFELIFDTYYKKVSNLQRSITLATTTGFASVLSNDASVLDYGYELTLTARPLSKTSKVVWTISANGAINKDYLTQLPGNKNQIIVGSTVLKVGRNTLSNFLLKNKGVYSTNQQVPVDPVTGLKLRTSVNSTAFFKAGDPIWQDLNGDYVIDDNDKQVLGNSQPIVIGGMSSFIGYKSFSVNINASYTFKRDILNGALSSRLTLVNNPFNANAILPLADLNYWKRPGDNAVYPNPYDYSRSSAISPFRADQTLFQESGSYFKINNVTVAYSVDKKLVNRLGLANLKVYFSANNIITFSPYSGPNPENVTALGYDASGGYPVSRTYNLGFNLDF